MINFNGAGGVNSCARERGRPMGLLVSVAVLWGRKVVDVGGVLGRGYVAMVRLRIA